MTGRITAGVTATGTLIASAFTVASQGPGRGLHHGGWDREPSHSLFNDLSCDMYWYCEWPAYTSLSVMAWPTRNLGHHNLGLNAVAPKPM